MSYVTKALSNSTRLLMIASQAFRSRDYIKARPSGSVDRLDAYVDRQEPLFGGRRSYKERLHADH